MRRGPAGIWHRLYRPEIILATRACFEAAESLKVWIVAAGGLVTAFLEIGRLVIYLPNFDNGIPDRLTVPIQ